MYSLREAADAVGRGKPAILKAIKNGRISAEKDAFGQWRIDPAELHRVYPPVSPAVTGNGSEPGAGERQETPKETGDVGGEAAILRERLLADKEAQIADLRAERDRLLDLLEAQAGAVKLLTDERRKPPRRGWWPWRRPKSEG